MYGNQEERRYVVELNSACTRTSMNMLLIQAVCIHLQWKMVFIRLALLEWADKHAILNFHSTVVFNYVGQLESKERLRIQPAQLFHFSWWVMWCVQLSVDSFLVQFVQQTFPRCECDRLRQWTRWYQTPPTVRSEAWFGFCRRRTFDPVKFTKDLLRSMVNMLWTRPVSENGT